MVRLDMYIEHGSRVRGARGLSYGLVGVEYSELAVWRTFLNNYSSLLCLALLPAILLQNVTLRPLITPGSKKVWFRFKTIRHFPIPPEYIAKRILFAGGNCDERNQL